MKKQLLSILLSLCAVLALCPVTARAADVNYTVTGGNLYFNWTTGAITGCDKTVTEAIIPHEIHGVPVTSIESQAFQNCRELTSVTISSGVTTIGYKAFDQCVSLTSVTIPNSVISIGSEAFNECRSLVSVAIPNGVTSIGEYTFNRCVSLTSVTIPDSVTIIGQCAFNGCGSLAEVTIPGSAKSIRQYAFSGCVSLASVTVLEGVTRIESYAFENCAGLTSIALPGSLTDIAMNAFTDCRSLSDVYFGGSIQQWAAIRADTASNTPLLGANLHFDSAAPSTPTTPPAIDAVLSPQKLTVNGSSLSCEKYNINGSNYFKLRDLAYALSGTGSQFGVGFDEASSTVSITTGAVYTPTGTELMAGVDNSAAAQPSSQSILIDGAAHSELTVYNIGGSNFFQLRELGSVLGFEVGYDVSTNTAIVRSIQK